MEHNKRPIEEGATRTERNEAADEEASAEVQEIQASLGNVFYQIVRLQNLLRGPAAGESS